MDAHTMRTIIPTLVLVLAFCPQHARSLQKYTTELPNIANWPAQSQGLGHLAPAGAGETNQFGKHFALAGYTWTVELCRNDSDGDSQSNGWELGDPDCTWVKGSPPTRTTDLSHPGDPASKTTSAPPASPPPGSPPPTGAPASPLVDTTTLAARPSYSLSGIKYPVVLEPFKIVFTGQSGHPLNVSDEVKFMRVPAPAGDTLDCVTSKADLMPVSDVSGDFKTSWIDAVTLKSDSKYVVCYHHAVLAPGDDATHYWVLDPTLDVYSLGDGPAFTVETTGTSYDAAAFAAQLSDGWTKYGLGTVPLDPARIIVADPPSPASGDQTISFRLREPVPAHFTDDQVGWQKHDADSTNSMILKAEFEKNSCSDCLYTYLRLKSACMSLHDCNANANENLMRYMGIILAVCVLILVCVMCGVGWLYCRSYKRATKDANLTKDLKMDNTQYDLELSPVAPMLTNAQPDPHTESNPGSARGSRQLRSSVPSDARGSMDSRQLRSAAASSEARGSKDLRSVPSSASIRSPLPSSVRGSIPDIRRSTEVPASAEKSPQHRSDYNSTCSECSRAFFSKSGNPLCPDCRSGATPFVVI